MSEPPDSPDRARQFLPFAALTGFAGLIDDAEAADEARFTEVWEAPAPPSASASASAPFLRIAESRPWDMRLARILRHERQHGEECDGRGGQGGEQER